MGCQTSVVCDFGLRQISISALHRDSPEVQRHLERTSGKWMPMYDTAFCSLAASAANGLKMKYQ